MGCKPRVDAPLARRVPKRKLTVHRSFDGKTTVCGTKIHNHTAHRRWAFGITCYLCIKGMDQCES